MTQIDSQSGEVGNIRFAQRSAHTFTTIDDLNNRRPVLEQVPLQLDRGRVISRRLEAPNFCYKTLLSYLKAWFAIVSSNDEFDVYPKGFNANELNSLMHDFIRVRVLSVVDRIVSTVTCRLLSTTGRQSSI
ncbi:unnamed protein product [Ambrosiozyma monospora]|uniref:Unnamed protein product n=1 Tax=Ambrosiozyma monospora TaxID=43982 RepID=A0ACB5SYV6_AMBMO|nr:unnamed protein product [Ambrosiozyma monospora]